MIKVIIAGSQSANKEQVFFALKKYPWVGHVRSVVSGCAIGADEFGEMWAKRNGMKPILYPADWVKYGRDAGPIRNEKMAQVADALIAVWNGYSKGTYNMIKQAHKYKLPAYICVFNNSSTLWKQVIYNEFRLPDRCTCSLKLDYDF